MPSQLPVPTQTRDRACVALVLAGDPDDLRLAFIRRARREGDIWSGQMALPGGRAARQDPTARAVAERETLEEVGVDLRHADFLGALDEHSLRAVVATDAVLCPFVYRWPSALPRLRPEAAEVAAAYWTPVAHLWDPTHKTTVPWEHQGVRMKFPGIQHGDDVIWGLTHRVLMSFGQRVGRPLP